MGSSAICLASCMCTHCFTHAAQVSTKASGKAPNELDDLCMASFSLLCRIRAGAIAQLYTAQLNAKVGSATCIDQRWCTLICLHRWRWVFCCKRVVRLGGSFPSSLMKVLRNVWFRKSACALTVALLAFLTRALGFTLAGSCQATAPGAASGASSCAHAECSCDALLWIGTESSLRLQHPPAFILILQTFSVPGRISAITALGR